MKKAVINDSLTNVTGLQFQIFSVAMDKLRREEREKVIKDKYYIVCINAKMCPTCGSQGIKVKDVTEYHERMMEDEYAYTVIACSICNNKIKVYAPDRYVKIE